jgi:hypothetical protein
MAYQQHLEITFGSSRAHLVTVGYQLYNSDGTANGPRITEGVTEVDDGLGHYEAVVLVPINFLGRIVWDTGQAPPVYASEDLSTPQPPPVPQAPEPPPDAQRIIRAGIPEVDDCPILTRIGAYVVEQGVHATLEHVFRDRKGNPVDLSDSLALPVSASSASTSTAAHPTGTVLLRVKEWLGVGANSVRNPIWEVRGSGRDPAAGTVRVTLDDDLTALPGIYELSFAVTGTDGKPLLVNQGILSVERSLFYDTRNAAEMYRNLGPPTLMEVRMWMMDSSPNENLLLDDVEFKDEQILLAMTEPVRLWNESPPPIETYTTRDFPWRGAWASGVLGRLHLMAATGYRRNRLAHSAGGVSVDDKNKEREYAAEGQRLWEEYKAWMFNKKIERNLRKFVGQGVSAYSARAGW